jgi:hypothetical protein
MLYWAERETDFVPVSEGDMPSRVEEYAFLKFKIEYSATKPKPRKIFESHDGVILARLKKIRNAWKVDKKFRVRQVKKT